MRGTSLTMSTGISSFRTSFLPNGYIAFKSSSLSLSMIPSRLPHDKLFGYACPRRRVNARSISISVRGGNNGRINLQRDRFGATVDIPS